MSINPAARAAGFFFGFPRGICALANAALSV